MVVAALLLIACGSQSTTEPVRRQSADSVPRTALDTIPMRGPFVPSCADTTVHIATAACEPYVGPDSIGVQPGQRWWP